MSLDHLSLRRTLRKHEIPAVYGMSRSQVSNLIRSGVLPVTRVGRAVMIDVRDADRLFGVRHAER